MTTCMADPAIAGKLKLEALYVQENTINPLSNIWTYCFASEASHSIKLDGLS